jgi:hypothetical protein
LKFEVFILTGLTRKEGRRRRIRRRGSEEGEGKMEVEKLYVMNLTSVPTFLLFPCKVVHTGMKLVDRTR